MKRHELVHYLNTALGGGEAKYALIGDGVASATEEFNPEEETNHWINQISGSTDLKSYTPSMEIERKDCVDDDMQEFINKLEDELPTGGEATTDYVRLRLKDKIVEADGKYVAYRRACTVMAVNTGGDAGDYNMDSIKIGGKGDSVKGYFDVKTKTFTEGEYSAGA